jgi:hypothetical protein
MIYKGGFGRLFLCSEKENRERKKLLRPHGEGALQRTSALLIQRC